MIRMTSLTDDQKVELRTQLSVLLDKIDALLGEVRNVLQEGSDGDDDADTTNE